MADILLGGHRRIVEELASRLRALQSGDLTAPRVVLLRAPAGEGKSRIIRELFSKLREKGPEPRYWPPLSGAGRSGPADPVECRNEVTPEGCIWPEHALPSFGWWSFDGARISTSAAYSAVAAARPQWEAHGLALMLAWNEATGLWTRAVTEHSQVDEGLLEEVRDASEGALEAVLSEANVAVPFVGALEDWGWRGGRALAQRQQDPRMSGADLDRDLGRQPLDSEASEGIALGRTLRSLSHPKLPAVIVVENMNLMGSELTALVEEVSVADPEHPVLVIGTVLPDGPQHEQFTSWFTRSRGRVEMIDVPGLAAADLITLLREHAPHTEDATAMRVVARLGGPLHLGLWLTSRAIRRHIEEHAGAIVQDAVTLPEHAADVLRQRWEELPGIVRRVLASAAAVNPLPQDDLAHFVPELFAEVTKEFWEGELTLDQVHEALQTAAQRGGWTRVYDDVQYFRDGVLAETARGEARLAFGGEDTAKLREIARRRIEQWIMDTHDEYTLPETEAAALLARWFVALTTPGASGTAVPSAVPSAAPSALPSGPASEALAAAQWRVACDAAGRYDYADAVTHGTYALTTLRRVLGDDHPANYLLAQRESKSAQTSTALQPSPAPDVAPEWAMQLVIAEWLGEQGHPDQSIEELRRLLADMERYAGTRHLATLTVRSNLASQLRDAGVADEAIGQFQTVIADLTAVVGPLARETLDARGGLAEAFGLSGQYDAAVSELRALIPLFFKVYGESHADTFLVRGALAAFLSQGGQPRAAVEQARMLLDDQEQMLGVDDPQVLTTRNNLAVMLLDSGDPEAAADQFEQLVTERTEVLGATSPDTLDTRMNLAAALLEAGQSEAAVREYESTLAVMSQTLAPDHLSVLRGRGHLAESLGRAGDARAAAVALRALERDMARALGPRANDTAMIAEAARYWERGGDL